MSQQALCKLMQLKFRDRKVQAIFLNEDWWIKFQTREEMSSNIRILQFPWWALLTLKSWREAIPTLLYEIESVLKVMWVLSKLSKSRKDSSLLHHLKIWSSNMNLKRYKTPKNNYQLLIGIQVQLGNHPEHIQLVCRALHLKMKILNQKWVQN